MSRPVLSIRLGVAGSGKTLSCVIFACREFLPFETGRLISNLPFLPEKIGERYAGTKGVNGPMTAEEIAARFEAIPKETLDQWKEEQGGPWEYFKDRDISGCHIMLDEAHNFVGAKHDHKWRKKWQQWVGELRHVGATIELITQAEGKLAKEFKEEAERQVIVSSSDTRRDPIFGIECGDIYQLLAKLMPKRGYRAATWVAEKRSTGGLSWRKFSLEKESKYTRDPSWFELYVSHNEPHNGGVAGRRQLQYEILGWGGFLKWFLTRNLGNIVTSRFTKGVAVATLVSVPYTRNLFLDFVKGSFASFQKKAVAQVEQKAKEAEDKFPRPVKRKEPQPTPAPEAAMSAFSMQASRDLSQARGDIAANQALTFEERASLINEIDAVRARYEADIEKAKEFVGIVGDDLITREGELYAVGDKISGGPLDGKTIKSLDRRRREIVLDDDSRVRIGRMLKAVQEDRTPVDGGNRVQPAGTNLPRDISGARVGSAGSPKSGGRGAGVGGSRLMPVPDSGGMGQRSFQPVDRSRPGAPRPDGGAQAP